MPTRKKYNHLEIDFISILSQQIVTYRSAIMVLFLSFLVQISQSEAASEGTKNSFTVSGSDTVHTKEVVKDLDDGDELPSNYFDMSPDEHEAYSKKLRLESHLKMINFIKGIFTKGECHEIPSNEVRKFKDYEAVAIRSYKCGKSTFATEYSLKNTTSSKVPLFKIGVWGDNGEIMVFNKESLDAPSEMPNETKMYVLEEK